MKAHIARNQNAGVPLALGWNLSAGDRGKLDGMAPAFGMKVLPVSPADAGKTVLFSTHVLDVAEKVVDRVGIIAHGELLFVGTVDQMREHFRNNGSLEEMFLELTGENSPLAGAGSVAEDAGAPVEEM